MEPHPERKRELAAFIERAVDRARHLAGPLLERADLEQAAELAMLEVAAAGAGARSTAYVRRCRRRIVHALKSQLRIFGHDASAIVHLDELLVDDEITAETARPPLSLVWDGETSEEAATKAELTVHVREIVDGMPDDTAQVVRLCFGLDGGDAVAPIDVADILDEPPQSILGHLWVAEKLFRHFSSDGTHRRLTPMTALEFQAFRHLRDLAWYDLRRLNLNNADLRYCDLSHADLSGMNLWGLRLAGARAHGVNLWGALLDGADLVRADLRHANLERAGVRRADLRDANLSGANLWGVDLAGAKADRATLVDADLRAADLLGADLTRANLSGADLRGADLREAKLVGAELVGANLQGAALAGADLRWADLRNSDLCWSNLWAADLAGATMRGATRSPKLTGVFAGRAPMPRRLRPVAEPA
ncbi:MAG: pentapeptide repeat-containing protein [Actinomycetota bacterium]